MYPEQMTGTDFYSLTQDDLTGLGQLNLVTDVCETCPPEIPDNFTATIVGQDVVLTWDPYDYYVIGLKFIKMVNILHYLIIKHHILIQME